MPCFRAVSRFFRCELCGSCCKCRTRDSRRLGFHASQRRGVAALVHPRRSHFALCWRSSTKLIGRRPLSSTLWCRVCDLAVGLRLLGAVAAASNGRRQPLLGVRRNAADRAADVAGNTVPKDANRVRACTGTISLKTLRSIRTPRWSDHTYSPFCLLFHK